jgi:DNA repair photolyase
LEAAISGIQPQSIYMGWHTDPYQPCEKEYCQTRQVLELLQPKGFSASILTKSDLILRDMDVLRNMDQASVSVSVAFKDNAVRQLFEADTMDTEPRIDALRKFKAEGVPAQPPCSARSSPTLQRFDSSSICWHRTQPKYGFMGLAF